MVDFGFGCVASHNPVARPLAEGNVAKAAAIALLFRISPWLTLRSRDFEHVVSPLRAVRHLTPTPPR